MNSADSSDSFRFLVEAETGAVRVLRTRMRARLEAAQVAPSTADSVILAVDELVNNAIDHGGDYRENRDRLHVEVAIAGDRVGLTFLDPSAPSDVVDELTEVFGASVDSVLPALELERGRGLFLIATCLEDLKVSAAAGGGLMITGSVRRA
ncbi:MAG: ATP-binding protein [Planctomycetota bacterium]